MASLGDKLTMLYHFAHTRWWLRLRDLTALESHQQQQLKKYFADILPRANYYTRRNIQSLDQIPYMDKAAMMANFAERNSAGIPSDIAMKVALAAETSRDFNSTLQHPALGELTVGLSSGTSGHRGLFLVSRAERLRWAGILLAKTLPTPLLLHILCIWRAPLAIAFFLRANSNLYNTLNSKRIDFGFYDLLQGVDIHVAELERQRPHVLVAPATVLRRLAELKMAGQLTISPVHLLNVAEVLEPDDAEVIARAFSRKPHQIYQATEGFLAYTCERGNLHLNESHIYVEKEWLDETRFHPIITDFSRSTQLIVRYRLNDVLQLAPQACPCGRAELHLAAIEGRADQILWLTAKDKQASLPFILMFCAVACCSPTQVFLTIALHRKAQFGKFNCVAKAKKAYINPCRAPSNRSAKICILCHPNLRSLNGNHLPTAPKGNESSARKNRN